MSKDTPLSKQELRKQILSLCDKLREHVDLDHPDPDMTRPCQWPSDTTDKIMTSIDRYSKQREVEARIDQHTKMTLEAVDFFPVGSAERKVLSQYWENEYRNLVAPQPLSPEQRGKP